MTAVFSATAAFFDALADSWGEDARASDWGSDASQRIRFAVLAEIVDLRGARVLDVGCGTGRFADYLRERGKDVDYVGIDLSSRAIERGRAAHPDLDLRVGNVLDLDPAGEHFDVVVANGIFYRLGPEGADTACQLVERMWSIARRSLAFTSLSSWANGRPGDELRLDPLETLAHARTLTQRVALWHDYLPHDFCVCLRRPGVAR